MVVHVPSFFFLLLIQRPTININTDNNVKKMTEPSTDDTVYNNIIAVLSGVAVVIGVCSVE